MCLPTRAEKQTTLLAVGHSGCDLQKSIDFTTTTAWNESMISLQPPPSLDKAILVRWCKLVESQMGTSTRLQLTLFRWLTEEVAIEVSDVVLGTPFETLYDDFKDTIL